MASVFEFRSVRELLGRRLGPQVEPLVRNPVELQRKLDFREASRREGKRRNDDDGLEIEEQ